MFRRPRPSFSPTSFLSKVTRTDFLLTALLLLLHAPSTPRAQTGAGPDGAPEITTLEPGKAVERELAGGGRHVYQIALAAGQYAGLIVEQRGIDVVVRLLGADGRPVVEFDAEIRNRGPEAVELAAEAAGSYRLAVVARQKAAPAGRYEIRVTEIHAATEKERALHEARKLMAEVTRLYRAGKPDEALPLAERVVAIREKELGADHPDFGMALFALANQYSDKGDYATAEPLYRRALAIREKALGKVHLGTTPVLNNLGNLYKDKGDYVTAELLYQRAFDIRERSLEPDHLL
ncbi:MAG: tetratricopeptide repeat protein, partial [Pyrinomonadaceae bacterium]